MNRFVVIENASNLMPATASNTGHGIIIVRRAPMWPTEIPIGIHRSRPKKKSGFQLDVDSTKDASPDRPKRERTETRSPELVGGGPMRRRWR